VVDFLGIRDSDVLKSFDGYLSYWLGLNSCGRIFVVLKDKLTKNFRLIELACHDGTDVPEELYPNALELATNLQVLRDFMKKAIAISSGYRTPAWNKKIGGEPKSQHMLARASDIKISGVPPDEVKVVIETLIKRGAMRQGGLGLYPTFVHYDCRGTRARWLGKL